MVEISSKRILTINTRPERWTCQRNKHNKFYQKRANSNRKEKRCHLRKLRLRVQTKQRGDRTHQTYCRRRQNQLPGRLWHTNCRHDTIQDICQEHYFNTKCKMFHDVHKRFLPEYTNEATQIYAPKNHRHSRRGN